MLDFVQWMSSSYGELLDVADLGNIGYYGCSNYSRLGFHRLSIDPSRNVPSKSLEV
jgi:hypothetical protein